MELVIGRILQMVLSGVAVYRQLRNDYNASHPSTPLPLPSDPELLVIFGGDLDAQAQRIDSLLEQWRADVEAGG